MTQAQALSALRKKTETLKLACEKLLAEMKHKGFRDHYIIGPVNEIKRCLKDWENGI